MKQLLEGQEVEANFRSKAGKSFCAKVYLNADGDYTFDFHSENGHPENVETKVLQENQMTADETAESEKESK